MTTHLLWLWLWFAVGEMMYVLKRAYFMVKGPSPTVTSYGTFFADFWPALIVRGMAGATIYWLTFYPDLIAKIASWVGLTSPIPQLPQIGVVALLAGLSADAVLDMLIAKIPFLGSWLPTIQSSTVSAKSTNGGQAGK